MDKRLNNNLVQQRILNYRDQRQEDTYFQCYREIFILYSFFIVHGIWFTDYKK